ncbi:MULTISPECIES: hypothetical protein [unclassified Staphylococcus]|uniref:hypothetical protein n=1 Tax=unclassified Staphylococcus TaxID=91994 RepID=UPI0021CEE1C3|nr:MULTISPECIES: hypothetical protein [unclassified Staphylococcus]UXR71102.1 hypothetical protein MUA88_07880 [Staphylococcus sp. IVB6240]UXR73396.1 hypothetical protein MUA48_08455 [Staphylococcus sp. IVB6238]UXR75692.1 hypothetical protein MUA74_08455 [Staphylococcus sp. IVB6233]UXR79890.1 hypothetical protein MUA65_08050 [Staphylococcus sp. IVB6218]
MITLIKRNFLLGDSSKAFYIVSYLFMIVILTYYYMIDQSLFLSLIIMLLGALSGFPVYTIDYLNHNQSYVTFRSLPVSDRLLLKSFNLYTLVICSVQVSTVVLIYLIAPFPNVFEVMAGFLSLTLLIATFCVRTILDEFYNKWISYVIFVLLMFSILFALIGPLTNGVDLFWFNIMPWILLILSVMCFSIKTILRYRRLGRNKIRL